ncbi:NB-ARC domain-containing protein [Reticulomyxa filosa]|uniref:NB-ARC domain-containing protein n=1 Tax=Reticulomyxa filosa TaxID=46433 RepID=X6LRM0_RETFI|nr:NB-ARC domain-containing protein [Reticulomyxa filosa]|eukprot:ETO04528.1 NB-ARC domain-containing protein [Reticulomyxa filosa]
MEFFSCESTFLSLFHSKSYSINNKDFILIDKAKCKGGMSDSNDDNSNINAINEKDKKYEREIKILIQLFGNSINKEELKQKIIHNNGNIELVIKELVQLFVEKEDKLRVEKKINELEQKQEQENTMNIINTNNKSVQKEIGKTETGKIKPGINLQGYCIDKMCLASKAELPVWINIGFNNITFISDKTYFNCPDCKKETITHIVKAMFYNSEHSICKDGIIHKDNNYECSYTIKSGSSYELNANKIRQHANSIEDLRKRSQSAMDMTKLQKYDITVVKSSSLKEYKRLLEKIQIDYGGDFNQVFDIGRFTILCDDSIKLQTAVAVMKKANQFNLIVSEDKDFFNKKSKTHYRIHNIKLYVPKDDVYIEMQATLKKYTTLEGYTLIENPKLISDKTLTKINDIICEWIDENEIKKIANRYKSHSEIRILKPPQLKEQINYQKDIILKLTDFIYNQLCIFNPIKIKGQAVYVILFEFFKKYIIGEINPTSCIDVISILKESRKQELEEDITILQALETYIPLQANNCPYTDDNDNEKNDSYDCHQHILNLLIEQKEEEEKKNNNQQKQEVIILQGKSGSGKSLFCYHLENILWELYLNGSSILIPIYISLPKYYNELNEKQIISQALQMKQINKEIIDNIRENISFIFILDGFDEIFDKYDNNNNSNKYFYDRFNLSEWNAKIIITCRSNVLNDENIENILIGSKNIITTSMIYLWPFSKEQMHGYIDKFIKMNKKNKINDNLDWTIQQYKETLQNYPNLNKMMEEPFLLQMILTVLPSLTKQHPIGTKISKSQVYEAFNEQWIDVHVKNIINKLLELRIQINFNKIKLSFHQYCQDLGFEMFIQGNQVATENDYKEYENNKIYNKLDPKIEIENKNEDEKLEIKENESNIIVIKKQDIWDQYFNGDSIAKYILRKVGNNKYQFLHKSCQEYYVSQKIIFDILSWKPNIITINNQQFQQQFEIYVQKLFINYKLLNEELGIIQFIAERIHDNNPIFSNLKSRLFRIIESSKNNNNINIAAANAITILNSANINMDNQNWSNVKIPYAILDRAFLEGTNFSNANLDHVRFYQTCLTKVNFTNASMNNIYFGEYVYLEGHSSGVMGIQFLLDETKVVSYSNDKTIRIWDTISRDQLCILEGHLDEICGIQISHDKSKIISYSFDNTIRIWDILSGQQIQILEGHTSIVTAAQFSLDCSKVISSSCDNTIRIWDVSSGNQINKLEGHSNHVNTIKFSPDYSKIVSCSEDKSIRIWDISSGIQIQLLEGHLDDVIGVYFISNGLQIISYSSDKTIRIWDIISGQQIQILEGHTAYINGIQFSPDNSKILSYSNDTTIRLWDLLSGKQLQIFEGHMDWVKISRFSSDGSKIVSGSIDTTIRIWDVSSGKQIQVLEGHSNYITGVEFFSNEHKILSCAFDGTIRIWDTALEKKIQLTGEELGVMSDVKFSPDGTKIVSCSGDKIIRLWDVQSGTQIQIFEGHSNAVYGVLFSIDGSKIISYSDDTTIRIWDILSGKQIQILKGHSDEVNNIQFLLDDDSKLVSCSKDKTIRIWDILSGRQIQLLKGHFDDVNKIQISPDGSKIVSCSDDATIRVWDVSSGDQILLLKKHTDFVNNIRISPDGTKIISCSDDKTIRVWDISSGDQILLLEGHQKDVNDIKIFPDNTTIVSCSDDNTIRFWDILAGEQIQILEGHSNGVIGIYLSSDYSKIISCSQDKTIRIWEVSSGEQIQLLEGHNGNISGIDISPDDSKLVSCSRDKTIRLWSSDNGKIIDVTEESSVDCIWKVGTQGGLSIKNSIWKDTKGVTSQQKLLVKQRGGIF